MTVWKLIYDLLVKEAHLLRYAANLIAQRISNTLLDVFFAMLASVLFLTTCKTGLQYLKENHCRSYGA
jgi:hypothetical protein